MIGKLEYCGGGQIRDAKTKQLVSPREIVQAWNESQAVNAAAMRGALRALRDASRKFCHQILNSKYNKIFDKYTCVKQGFSAVLDVRDAIVMANYALATPPRNFDVGTAEDQSYRFAHYCVATGCGNCSLGTVKGDCEFAWAQMPYAEEGVVK